MGKGSKPKEVYHVGIQELKFCEPEVISKARVVPVESSEDEKRHDKKGKSKGKKKKKPVAKWEYYVKWANYDSDANSWEPEENLEGCQRLRESFWRHVGMDDRDYMIGYEVSAAHHWIESEKAFFKSEFAMAQEESERQKKEFRDAKKAKKRKSQLLKQGSIVVSPRPTSEAKHKKISSSIDRESSEDERPLMTLTIPLSNKKRKRIVASSEDEVEIVDSRPQKYAKLDDSAREEETVLSRAASHTSLFSAPSSPDLPLSSIVLSAAPTASTSMVADVPSLSNISQRPDNPYSNIADMSPSELTRGISIKQRLGMGALTPTNPKVGPPPPKKIMKPPLPRSHPSASLAGLKINKRTPALSVRTDVNPPSGHEPSLGSAIDASMHSPYPISSVSPMHSPHPISNVSPNITTTLTPNTPAVPYFHRPEIPNRTISPLTTPMDEAERFLQEIMPSGLADPLLPAQEPIVEPLPPLALHPKPALPGRIPKRWQWLGPLYLNASTSLFCNVKIHNLTEQKSSGMRFSVAFEGVTDLSVSIYNVFDLRRILPAFRPWTQLALLSAQEEKDHEAFKVLYHYLEKALKVILRPIFLDNNVVGQILISPPGMINVLHHLNVPKEFAQPDNLVVALLPWVLSSNQLAKEGRLPNSEPHTLAATLESDRWTRSMRVKPAYQHALRILGFPEELHNYMHDRLFCVWWNHQTSSKNVGLETKLLHNIMEQARAKPAGYTTEARVIFVHVSALTTLHKLPGLVERRSKRPHVHFYTYGSHEHVFPSLWSVKEIYPCGGIITFSPSAMFHNPIDILQKIRQINAHSLWECYILPSALGMLARMVCGDDDPLTVFERGEFSHEFILKAIAAGEMALIYAPPEKTTIHSADDNRQIWMRQHLSLTAFTAKRALEIGLEAFHSKYANVPESEWPQTMENEILMDLSSMQRQPAIMKDYRRYVVFISERDRANPTVGGLEWTTISKFDFRDNFHPSKQIINT